MPFAIGFGSFSFSDFGALPVHRTCIYNVESGPPAGQCARNPARVKTTCGPRVFRQSPASGRDRGTCPCRGAGDEGLPRAMGGQFGHRTATGRDPRPGPCRLGQGGHMRDDDASVLGMRIKRGQLSGSHGARTVPTSRPACAKRRVAGVRIPNASRVRRRRGRARQCMECSGSLALLGQRHAARRPTDPPLPSKPVPRPTLFRCSPEDIAPQMAIFHPRPGRVSPTKRQGPEHSKASPVGPLPPAVAEVPVAGRKPKSAPESVGSPQKSAIHILNKPPRSRALCRSEPRERRGTMGFSWASFRGRPRGEIRTAPQL
jgi:hypothetical protein